MTLWQLFKAIPRGLATVIVGVGTFLSRQWSQYTEFGQFLWILALFAMAVDAGISYEFGSTLSTLHAAGFALVALAFCILPDVAALEFRKGRTGTAGWMGVACIPLGIVAFLTHVGYGASIRVGDMQQSDVSNVKYADTRKAVSDAQDKIKFFESRIADLKSANPWITSVSADGLKAQTPAIEEAILQETKRGGCGPKCLALKEKLADIMDRASKSEELASHEKMLLAAQGGLEKARATAAGATYASSTAVNHTDTLFKAISLVTGAFAENVTMTEREATNTGIMSVSSLAFLLLAPMFYFAAGLNRRRGVLADWIGGHDYDDAGHAAEAGSVPSVGSKTERHVHNHVSVSDDRAIEELRRLAKSIKTSGLSLAHA